MINGVESEIYYALLVWKDENMADWFYKSTHVYGVERLCDMSTDQLIHLSKQILQNND
tara:strand:+ start:573 stop:746 length:174 start_codon:yes stop_codon:yes gene_type:complete